MQGAGNLTPQEAARRAEKWFGARVEQATGKFKIFPPDRTQAPVVISDRWGNGSERLNAIKQLQRAGLDVINGQAPPDAKLRADGKAVPPHLTQGIQIPDDKLTSREDKDVTSNGATPTPAAVFQPPAKGPAPAAKSGPDLETVLGMLAEADARISALQREVNTLSDRVAMLADHEHQARGRYAHLSKRVQLLNEKVDQALSARPLTDAERAEAERQELLRAALELLESLPDGVTLSSGSIAASLGRPDKGGTLGKLLTNAAKEGKVMFTRPPGQVQNLYRAVRKEGEK